MSEPGLDRHAWGSEWASVEETAADDPGAALSQYTGIVERMLVERGFGVDDPVAASGGEPEIVATYTSARKVAERAEVGEASRPDVEAALEDVRALFETLTAERP